jgi:hypothetical protein
MLHFVYLLLSAFFFLHAYRDYLQAKGKWNWFTKFGHIWDAPQYEVHGMVVAIALGTVFLYLGLQ